MGNEIKVGDYVKVLTDKFCGFNGSIAPKQGSIIEVCEECHSAHLGVWIDSKTCCHEDVVDWIRHSPEDFELIKDFLKSEEHVAVAEGSKEEVSQSLELPLGIKSNGGSSEYYQKTITRLEDGETFDCQTGDIIRCLVDNDFDGGNIVKAVDRIFQSIQGKGKEGTSIEYDCNKIIYFANIIKKRFEGK